MPPAGYKHFFFGGGNHRSKTLIATWWEFSWYQNRVRVMVFNATFNNISVLIIPKKNVLVYQNRDITILNSVST